MLSFLVTGAIIGLAGILLAMTGALDDFYADAIRFNTEVYNKYYDMRPERFMTIISVGQTFLQINEPVLWSRPEVLSVSEVDSFGLWLLGGFAFRLGILLATVQLLACRQMRAAITLYVIAMSLLLRSEVFFREQQAALFGFSVASLAVTMSLTRPDTSTGRLAIAGRWVAWASALTQALLLIVSGGKSVEILRSHWQQMSYEANFGRYPDMIQKITAATCNQPVHLAYYPSDLFVHFFSGIPPVGRYLFFYPWIAEVGTDETLADLRAAASTPTLVFIDRKGQVWGRPNADYMAPLLSYLDANYHQLDKNTFQSPALHAVCDP